MTMGGGAAQTPLNRLTSLRFFAALVVVVHHVTRDLTDIPGVTALATMGTAGVGFFFMLSGFVLTWSSREGDRPAAFYRRRFARVYPLHFVAMLAAIPVLLFIGSGQSLLSYLSNPLLLQAWVPDSAVYFGLNSPSWSLSAEALFYLLFPLVIGRLRMLGKRAVWGLLAGLLVAMIVIAAAGTLLLGAGDEARFLFYVFPPYRVLGFLVGCCAARLLLMGVRVRVPVAGAVVLLGGAYAAVFVGQRLFSLVGHGVEDALLAPFIALLLMSAAAADVDGKPGPLTRSALIRLGEWSFALYLTHWLLLEVAAFIDPGADSRALPFRVLEDGLFIALAIGVSAAAYYGIEKPLEKRLRGARPRPETGERRASLVRESVSR